MTKFIAEVYGTPDPSLTSEQVKEIIDRAEANGQNVFFGEGWRHPEQNLPRLIYASQPPVEMGLWKSLTATLAGWFL